MNYRILAALLLVVLVGVGGVGALPINLTSKNVLVEISGYEDITSGVTTNSGPLNRGNVSFYNLYNKQSIRQTGTINYIKLFYANTSAYPPGIITNLSVAVQHRIEDGNNTWQRTAQCNIANQIVNNTVVNASLCGGLPVTEGDVIEISFVGSGYAIFLESLSAMDYRISNPYLPNIQNLSVVSKYTYHHTFKTLGNSPVFVAIGDSLTAGFPRHQTGIEHATTTQNVTNQYPWHVSAMMGNISYQNMGISGQSCSAIRGRFMNDTVNLSPTVAMIMCGQNDYASHTDSGRYITNVTAMLDMAIANNITPVVIEMTPNSLGTTTQMQTRDSWTALIEQEISTNYTGTKGFAYLVNSSTYTGQFRAGGDPGNLWDIKPNMISPWGDGHFNETGYTALAQAVVDKITATNSAAPVAQFTPAGPVSLTYPNGQAFTDTSTGSPTNWNWSYKINGIGDKILFNITQNSLFLPPEVANYRIYLNISTAWGFADSNQVTWVNVTNFKYSNYTIVHNYNKLPNHILVTLERPNMTYHITNITTKTFDLFITNVSSGFKNESQKVNWCVG